MAFVCQVHDRSRQLIVDESFGAFTTISTPSTVAPLVGELRNLVVVNGVSTSHGSAGLRLGYAVAAPTAPLRARQLRRGSPWNLNAFAEWCCELLMDPAYRRAYELDELCHGLRPCSRRAIGWGVRGGGLSAIAAASAAKRAASRTRS